MTYRIISNIPTGTLNVETEVHKKEKFVGMYFMCSYPIIAASISTPVDASTPKLNCTQSNE